MNRVVQDVDASPERVWRVLEDGWLYPLWVVGATRMRHVDDDWPSPGTTLEHSVGVWPLTLDDDTEVIEAVPHQLLRLRARARPGGEAEVEIRIEPRGSGSRVSIAEDLAAGPARLVPVPIRSALFRVRNRETLRRLAWIAERRQDV